MRVRIFRRQERYSIRSKIDPFTWMSLGGNVSMNNRFSKTAGTASNSDSLTVGGNTKFASSKNSLMLKYDMTKRDSSNKIGPISNSTTHNQSVTIRRTWSSGIGSNFGFRYTLMDREGGGVETHSKTYAPNFNIDGEVVFESEQTTFTVGARGRF